MCWSKKGDCKVVMEILHAENVKGILETVEHKEKLCDKWKQ